MVETIVLGILLFLILISIAVGTFLISRALGRSQRSLRAIRMTHDKEGETFTEMVECLRELDATLEALKAHTADSNKLREAQAKMYSERLEGNDRLEESRHIAQVKAIEEFSEHAKSMKLLVEGLGKVAKAQIAAVVQIESVVRLYTKNSFGLAGQTGNDWSFEESTSIKELMQGGMTRQEAELQIGEQRADSTYRDFDVTR